MDNNQFLNRRTAGLELARALRPEFEGPSASAVVLGMPGGGMPAAAVVARYLDIALYPLFVRMVGIPGHDNVSMGAIASEGQQVLDRELISHLGIPEAAVRKAVQRETEELRRSESRYREKMNGYPLERVAGKTVLIVNDGIADSAHDILAAIALARQHKPQRLLVAAPVISAVAAGKLNDKCEGLICLHSPQSFISIDYWYRQQVQEAGLEEVLPGRY